MSQHINVDMRIVFENDTAPIIEFIVTEEDGITPRDLSGHSLYVSFWNLDAAPHLQRAGVITNGPSGLAQYRLQGDEYNAAGTLGLQATFSSPDTSVTITGNAFFEASSDIVYRRVLAKP